MTNRKGFINGRHWTIRVENTIARGTCTEYRIDVERLGAVSVLKSYDTIVAFKPFFNGTEYPTYVSQFWTSKHGSTPTTKRHISRYVGMPIGVLRAILTDRQAVYTYYKYIHRLPAYLGNMNTRDLMELLENATLGSFDRQHGDCV